MHPTYDLSPRSSADHEYEWRTGAIDIGTEDEKPPFSVGGIIRDAKAAWELHRAASIGRSWEPVYGKPATPAQKREAIKSGIWLLVTILAVLGLAWLGITGVNQVEQKGNAMATYGAQGWEGHK